MMKRLILSLFLATGLMAADAANDLILTQRKSDNSGNIQRNLAPTARGLFTFDGSKVPASTTDLTYTSPTLSVPNAFVISSAGSIGLTAGGTSGVSLSGTGLANSGLLRFPTNSTTSAQGITMTDVNIFRTGTGVLQIEHSAGSGHVLDIKLGGNEVVGIGDLVGSSPLFYFRQAGSAGFDLVSRNNHPLNFYTNNTIAASFYNTDQSLRFPSTNTAGLQLYNTADQTTNVERNELLWGSNVFQFGNRTIGTATARPLNIFSQVSNAGAGYARIDVTGATNPVFRQGLFTSATNTTNFSNSSTGTFVQFNGAGTYTATSGTLVNFAITPTYNQASGTAANTDLAITRTETAVGSGAQFLITAGTTALGNQFTVGNRGAIVSSVQALSGAGAVNVTQAHTDYTSTGGAQALTLADGTAGQTKTICHVTDGGSGVLTPTTKTGFTTITFTNAGDSVMLRFSATGGWYIVGIFGAVAA